MKSKSQKHGLFKYKFLVASEIFFENPFKFFSLLTKARTPVFENFLEAPPVPLDQIELGLFCHIFYRDFSETFVEAISAFPRNAKIFVTTPDEEIRSVVSNAITLLGFQVDARVTPNLGRNFGPLLNEFRSEMLNFQYVVLIHSKKSLHSEKMGNAWIQREVELLLNPQKLSRAIGIISRYPNVGIISSNVTDLIRKLNFRWGKNLESLKNSPYRNLVDFEKARPGNSINFPAGGMFLANPLAISTLLSIPLAYSDFPPEEGQIDGTLQHGLERLIGVVSEQNGFSIAEYSTTSDAFYLLPTKS